MSPMYTSLQQVKSFAIITWKEYILSDSAQFRQWALLVELRQILSNEINKTKDQDQMGKTKIKSWNPSQDQDLICYDSHRKSTLLLCLDSLLCQ